MRGGLVVLGLSLALLAGCKKTEQITVGGNTPPDYKSIPTIKVENYVNRLFIDLLGREATETERLDRTVYLKSFNLSKSARDTLILELMLDSSYHVGDSSYRHAYIQRMYDLSKARFLEGAADDDIYQQIGNLGFAITVARLDGDSIAVFSALAEQTRYWNVIRSKRKLRLGLITYAEMCATMMNNGIYDGINMNSFNYVNATFDNLFGRNPTADEFSRAYDIIDKNIPKELFGQWAANKNEYCKVLTGCGEFYEAQIRWLYYVLLQREATTQEVVNLFSDYAKTKDLQKVQLAILRTDEYAQFIH